MTDDDLTKIGIEAIDARHRMQQAIAGRLHAYEEKRRRLRSFIARAPNAMANPFSSVLDHVLAGTTRY